MTIRRHTSPVIICMLALASVLMPAAAHAQQPDSARADSMRARTYLLPPLVVTAARTAVRPERVGFAIGAVLPAELDLRRPRNAAEALRDVAGAFIDEAAGPGGPTIVRLRGGEEVFTQIVMDGVQLNENGGFFDFQGLVPSNIERIEVMRGPQSALYGSSAVSGVVRFVTPRGRPGPLRASFYGEGSGAAENGRSWHATGRAEGGSDAITFSAGAGAGWQRGIYDIANDTRHRDASLRVDARPHETIELTGTARFLGMDGNLPVRDPGATRVPLDPNARNERDRTVGSFTARWTAPSARLSQHVRVGAFRETFVFEDERDDVAAEAPDLPFFIFDADFLLDSDRARTTLEYGGSYMTGETATLSYGVQWERESVSDLTAGEFGDGTQSLDRTSRAGFAELLLSPVERVHVLAGIRVEKYEDLDAAWTPRGSIVFDAVPDLLSLRAAAGRAFKAPNLQQQYLDNPFIRGNPDLEPETSTSWEIGADGAFADGRLALSLTYYDQRYDDLIRTVAVEDSETGQQINRNLGESRARGVEWDAAWRVAPDWTLGARGSTVSTEILENSGLAEAEYPLGESLPFRPSVVQTAYVETDAIERLTARLSATHVGAQTVLTERFSGQRADLDAYVLAGLALRWAVRDDVALHLRIDNLFDSQYETAFDRTGRPFDVAFGVRVGAR